MTKMLNAFLCTITLLSGCDEVINVENRPPQIKDIELCRDGADIFWQFTLSDPEEDPTDVALIIKSSAKESGIRPTESAATIAPGPKGDGLVGIYSGPDASLHRIQWAYCSPDGEPCRLTASIRSLTDSDLCSCLDDQLALDRSPPLTIRLQDRQDSTSEFVFPDGLRVRDTCTNPSQ